MEKFKFSSKCSLILCFFIAVAYSPLAVADSSIRDHAQMSSLRQQEEKSLHFEGDYAEIWNQMGDGPLMIASMPRESEINKMRLKITPEEYIDDAKPYLEFNCEASLEKGDELMWWQSFDVTPKTDQTFILSRFTEERDHGGNKSLKFFRVLWPTDNNTLWYCVKRHREIVGNKRYTISKTIEVVYHTKMDYIRTANIYNLLIHPKRTVFGVYYYNDKTPLEINCITNFNPQHHPLDRSYFVTWYEYKLEGDRKRILTKTPRDREYGEERWELSKFWKPSDNGTEIFCTREYWLNNVHITEGESERITLIYSYSYQMDECSPWLPWMSAAVATLVVFLAEGAAVALAVIICLRPKTSKTPNPAN